MELYHLYYYVTVLIAVAFPCWYYVKTREIASFGVLFPLFYFIYSFVAPLAVIHGDKLENVSRSFYIWEEIYPIADKPYVYLGHTYYLIFYLLWFAAFLVGRGRTASSLKDGLIPADNICFDFRFLPKLPLLFFVTAFLALTFYGILYSKFGSVIAAGVSVYTAKATREAQYQLSTMDKGIFSLWGSALLCLWTVVIINLKRGNIRRKRIVAIFALLMLGFYILAGFVIGDRSQLIIPLIAIFVVFTSIYRNINILSFKFLSFTVVVIALNFIIKSFRGDDPTQLLSLLLTEQKVTWLNMMSAVLFSVESFAAYTGMPFLIANNIPPLYGESLVHFVLSFVPRIIAPFRIAGSYSYSQYASYAGIADSGRGFTFHYVADWYFNFWFFGIVVGGILTGLLMGMVERKAKHSKRSVFWIAAFAMLCGAIPAHLRAGFEGIRAVFFEYWSLPFLLFIFWPYVKDRINVWKLHESKQENV